MHKTDLIYDSDKNSSPSASLRRYAAPMQQILILGATSAIAAEVAKIHASRGARLHLVGRNAAKLAQVAAQCGAAEVSTQTADFLDTQASERLILDAAATLGRVDVALVAHGDLGDQLESEKSYTAAEHILATNFLSVVALLIPLANHMEGNRAGKLGVITSVAGDRGRPRNYTYGSAKGALNVYLQGLRTRLYPANVHVTTLKIGPVDTPMTHDHKKHILFGKSEGVAKDIVRAMDAAVAEVYVPSFWGAVMPIVKNTPEAIFQRLPFLSGR